MEQLIQLRRGLKQDIPELANGEPGFCTDTHQLYVGTEGGNVLITGGGGVNTAAYDPYSEYELLEPYDVETVDVLRKKNEVTLTWIASESSNIQDYQIFNGDTLLGTTSQLTYTVTGLTPDTIYNLVLKARNTGGYSSFGRKVQVNTLGAYQISMPGTANNYMKIDNVTFTAIEFEATFLTKKGSWDNHILQCVTDTATKLYFEHSGLNASGVGKFNEIWVDGVKKTVSGSSNIPVVVDAPTKIRFRAKEVIQDNIFILANGSVAPQRNLAARITAIRLYLPHEIEGDRLFSEYDFTKVATNSEVADRMGNNPPIKLTGGSFILS